MAEKTNGSVFSTIIKGQLNQIALKFIRGELNPHRIRGQFRWAYKVRTKQASSHNKSLSKGTLNKHIQTVKIANKNLQRTNKLLSLLYE